MKKLLIFSLAIISLLSYSAGRHKCESVGFVNGLDHGYFTGRDALIRDLTAEMEERANENGYGVYYVDEDTFFFGK